MEWFANTFEVAQQWLFESLIQPIAFTLGQGGFVLEAFNGTAWLLVGLLQIAVLLLIFGPMQRRWPVEPITDKPAIRVDVIYTLIHRLGVFKLMMFFTLEPLFDDLFGELRVLGFGTFHLDQAWLGVTDLAVVSFIIYLVAFDFVNYWIHRGQHQFNWWWNLHSLHHSQRQMTMWSDNRNHLLDSILVDFFTVIAAQLIGVPPGQFIAIVAFTLLSESFQHANLKVWFGSIGERLWVSPRFHRLHHSIGIGHETAGKNTLGGHNFSVLLPWWDMLFGTANFDLRYDATGVRDQVEQGRDYGTGFWAQQWLGLKRLAGRA
ncbi:MAG: sterol desaturase family protein [Burkholderiaceae bacterium]|nr:sterol desaturase family protein [Burkholderiaceae bacterium]